MEEAQKVENAKIESYKTFPLDKHRPPSKGGMGEARHRHTIIIDGQNYSFFAAGARRWVYKSDTVSFEWRWDPSKKYRNVIPQSIQTRDKDGGRVHRGKFDWKPLRTAESRPPGRG